MSLLVEYLLYHGGVLIPFPNNAILVRIFVHRNSIGRPFIMWLFFLRWWQQTRPVITLFISMAQSNVSSILALCKHCLMGQLLKISLPDSRFFTGQTLESQTKIQRRLGAIHKTMLRLQTLQFYLAINWRLNYFKTLITCIILRTQFSINSSLQTFLIMGNNSD